MLPLIGGLILFLYALSFPSESLEAIGIVMGANIGTTESSRIISLDMGKFSSVLMAVGLSLASV